VREAGLLDRCPRFYVGLACGLSLGLAGLAYGFVVLGNSWLQLAVAAGLGVVVTQFGFLAHEAAHREICRSGPANDRVGLWLGVLVAGISFSWWKSGHNRHHASPNVVDRDPSVAKGVLAFTSADVASSSRAARAWYRHQGWLVFPLLLLAGLNLRARSAMVLLGRGGTARRRSELALLGLRTLVGLTALALVLPIGKMLAFVTVETVVFGFCMGSAFVPNHVGMPMLRPEAKTSFLHRQVLTARNIRGGRLMTAWMGGLNYQIEHHLFPSMARPQLRSARVMVQEYCQKKGIGYTEATLSGAYRSVITYLNDVGLGAMNDPYQCPTSSMLGR
jgi:fatty acid desaturase